MHWLLAHFIGDFIIQNDWMAKNKKVSHLACFVHVVTYLIPFLLTELTTSQLLLIGIQHYAQDRWHFVKWFLDYSGKHEFGRAPLHPWSTFVVDGIFHISWITLVITYIN